MTPYTEQEKKISILRSRKSKFERRMAFVGSGSSLSKVD
jgi:hypothetical protein